LIESVLNINTYDYVLRLSTFFFPAISPRPAEIQSFPRQSTIASSENFKKDAGKGADKFNSGGGEAFLRQSPQPKISRRAGGIAIARGESFSFLRNSVSD